MVGMMAESEYSDGICVLIMQAINQANSLNLSLVWLCFWAVPIVLD
jgi:hypothetical protein